MSPRSGVAIGGGTGLPLVLGCLVRAGLDPTAVVTVADDGGSSGELRRELGILPPGDIRNCLVALSEPGNELARVFQYRFGGEGRLGGHALGNLVIAALADLEGGFAEGVEAAGRLLGVRGRVIPSTLADVVLSGRDASGRLITGQANVAMSEGPIRAVCVEPAAPEPNPAAIEAIVHADVIVIGPGSLFTSIIPNLLVARIAEAVASCHGTVVYVCNVANQRGETIGMDAADHVDALCAHGLEGALDVVLVADDGSADGGVAAHPQALARIAARGITVVTAPLVDRANPMHHDPAKLCAALSAVV